MISLSKWGSSYLPMINPCLLQDQRIRRGKKGKQQNNPKTKFEAPKPKVQNQQQEEPFGSKKNKNKGHHGKEIVKCSYCGKGFQPEHACIKNNLDESTSLLERNNMNLPEIFRRKENQDREYQHERGNALTERTSNSMDLLIDSGDSNHMMDKKESFSSLTPAREFPSTWEMMVYLKRTRYSKS